MAIAILEYIADKEWIMEGRVRAGVALASVMLAAEFSKIKISTLSDLASTLISSAVGKATSTNALHPRLS